MRHETCNLDLVFGRSDRVDNRLHPVPAMVRSGRISRLSHLLSSPQYGVPRPRAESEASDESRPRHARSFRDLLRHLFHNTELIFSARPPGRPINVSLYPSRAHYGSAV